MSSNFAIGIDRGGTHVKTVVVRPDGKVLDEDTFNTADGEPIAVWAGTIKRHVEELEAKHGRAHWIGIGSPGLAARDGRTITWMRGRLEDVQGFDWTDFFGRDLFVPVLNDAHAAIMGETWLGAAAGARDAVMLTLGTGVGGAIICDGHLLKGHLGRAGHLGHMSLDPDGAKDLAMTPGSIEDAIGNHNVSQRSNGRFKSSKELVDAHLAGDAEATRVWMKSVKTLAAHLASVINAVDPEVVILGGGVAKAGPALFDPLAKFMDEFEWRPEGVPVRIVPAKLGDRAGALGAARNAMTWSHDST